MVTLNWDEALDAASALLDAADRHDGWAQTGRHPEYDRAEARRLRALGQAIHAAYEAAHVACPECGRALDNGLCSTCDANRPSPNGWATTE